MKHRSTTPAKRNESPPEKPYPGFPLFAHQCGMWAKKIRKKLHYFGSWRVDPEGKAALEAFNREWPFLKDGRTPPPDSISADGCTLRELINDFLSSKEQKVDDGALAVRSFKDYFRTCEIMLQSLGKDRRVDDLRPDDFRKYRAKLAKRFGPVTLKNEITRAAMVFNYAFENQLIEKPVRYGQEFDRPSAKELRRHRNQGGAKIYTPDEVKRLLKAADVHLKAMILLGLNCGFGNSDCANLPISAVDLEGGWIEFARVKTEIMRRVPLWPETVSAIRESLGNRQKPARREYAGLMFLTRLGKPWVRTKLKKSKAGEKITDEAKNQIAIDAVCLQFGKLLKALKINGRRGLGFYSFRHCFETIGGEAKDQVAVDAIMGHVDPSMGGNYRHHISDVRLRAVVNTVHAWLFPEDAAAGGEGGAE